MKKKISLIIIILGIILFTCSLVGKDLENDVFYIIKVGEKVLENGVDFKEYFSWHENLVYTYPHWLFTAIIAIFYKIAELDGVFIFKCISSTIFALVIFFITYKRNKNYLLSAFMTLISVYFCKGMLEARAQILSYPLLFIEWHLLEKMTEEKKMKYVFALILIPILIVNLHTAMWAMSLVMYLPYIAEEILNYYKLEEVSKRSIVKNEIKLKKETNKNKKAKLKKEIEDSKRYLESKKKEDREEKVKITHVNNIKLIICLMFLTIFTGAISPQGVNGAFYTVKLNSSPTTKYIIEHQPLIVSSSVAFMVITAVLIIFAVKNKIKFRARDLFFILGFACLALMSNRGIIFYTVASCVIISKLIVDLMDLYVQIDVTKNNINKTAVIMFSVVILFVSIYNILIEKDTAYIDESFYPVSACEFLLKQVDYENIRLYNSYNYGSYLIYKGIPNFVDSRQDLYCKEFNEGVEVVEEVFYINYHLLNYKEVFEKYDITHALVQINTPEYWGLINDEEFKEIYSDEYFKIFEKR